jgi:dihydrofolate reductase
MAKVIAEMSMSLDGFVADENDGIDEVFAWYGSGTEELPMGNGMTFRLTERNLAVVKDGFAGVGAVLTGRRTSDLAGAWSGHHPVGCPAVVVSHRPAPDDLPADSTVEFVDSIEAAVERAKKLAGDKSIGVAGGDVVRQLLELGLLDEIRVSLVPVVLGKGVRFFGAFGGAPVTLEGPEIVEGDGVTFLHYRVTR